MFDILDKIKGKKKVDANVVAFPGTKIPEQKLLNLYTLSLHLRDNTQLQWQVQAEDDMIPAVEYWSHFTNWFTKQRTQYYTMVFSNGQTTFCRKDVKYFTIQTSPLLNSKT